VFELIVKQMEEILRQMQVTPVPRSANRRSHVHEAIGAIDRDDLPDQHVAEEFDALQIPRAPAAPRAGARRHNPKQPAINPPFAGRWFKYQIK